MIDILIIPTLIDPGADYPQSIWGGTETILFYSTIDQSFHLDTLQSFRRTNHDIFSLMQSEASGFVVFPIIIPLKSYVIKLRIFTLCFLNLVLKEGS